MHGRIQDVRIWLTEGSGLPTETFKNIPCYLYTLIPVHFLRHFIKKPAIVDRNFAPGAAIWRTLRNITLSFILAHWPHYVKT